MKRILLSMLLLLTGCVSIMNAAPRPGLALDEGRRLYRSFSRPAALPVAFSYGGVAYRGLGRLKLIDRREFSDDKFLYTKMRLALDKNVEVRADVRMCREMGEVEYTVWFANKGTEMSGVLENVSSADLSFAGSKPVVRGCLGDHGHLYSPYEKDLAQEKQVAFRSDGGRATHGDFPYFDLVHGKGGTLLAIGWAGTWNATFTAKGSSTRWQAQSCNGFRSVLMPGESVRTALVVMLPYKGRGADEATNMWREWFMKYNMPRYDASGKVVQPFSTTCFAADSGLPNSDGSISERYFTWRRTLDCLVHERCVPDFRWFDAGWYIRPDLHSDPNSWWGTVGTWEVDSVKWPGTTFRESNDACHAAGMKVLMWFEPERVTDVPNLVKHWGYNADWAISNGHGVFTNNIGDSACLSWTLRRITHTLGKHNVDLYREDNNSDPGTTWPKLDSAETARCGKPRTGITENKGIQGHYKLWDGIIAYCSKNGKCTFIDNCASGGGRNDIESLRRSMPFLRSDADRLSSTRRLSMSSTFNKWIPFCGALVNESAVEMGVSADKGCDLYTTRASWLPVYNISESYTHNVNLDFNLLRRTMGEWRKYSHLLVKDFYVLTPWHAENDGSGWTIFAYADRETGEAVITAFHQEKSDRKSMLARVPCADPTAKYLVHNDDTGHEDKIDGRTLRDRGFPIALPNKRTSALLHVTKLQ